MRLKIGLNQRMPEPYSGQQQITIPIFRSPADYGGQPIGMIQVENTPGNRQFLKQIADREVAFGCTFRTPTDIFGQKRPALSEVMAFHFMPTVEVMAHDEEVKQLMYGTEDDAS